MRRAHTLELTLRLDSIRDLFETPTTSPFSPWFGPHSTRPALGFITDEVRANSSYRAVETTFDVPDTDMTSMTDADVRDAVRRWAEARAHDISQDVESTRWRGLRFLLAGAIAFSLLIGATELIGQIDVGVATTLSRGLEVAAWVVLWFPIDSLIFALWQHRLDRRAVRIVADMDITITRR